MNKCLHRDLQLISADRHATQTVTVSVTAIQKSQFSQIGLLNRKDGKTLFACVGEREKQVDECRHRIK